MEKVYPNNCICYGVWDIEFIDEICSKYIPDAYTHCGNCFHYEECHIIKEDDS